MAEAAVEAIVSRAVRMNQLLVGKATKALRGQTLNLMNREALLDSLFVLYEECSSENLRKDKNVATFLDKFRAAVVEFKKLRVNHSDFEVVQIIGTGHFGHVQVVREKQTRDVYAMKVLRKSDTLAQQNVAFYEEERDIMAKASSPWITQLQYAFQDKNNIYFVMEFHPGGDLLALLDRFDDIFSEEMARFYLAEIALGISALHNMGYVHRDIKPDNVLLDRTGHIKLADFGSAAKLTVHGTVISKMPVGTPDYVAPEVLVCLENNSGTYGQSCDWWSLGIVAYEMLFGKTPFTDEKVVTTYSNIMNHKKTLSFPDGHTVSNNAVTLIRGLLEEVDNRFSLPQIVQQSFFDSLDWDAIRDSPPPFVPVVMGQDDTSNFDDVKPAAYKPDLAWQDRTGFSGKNLPFVGFTYTKLEEVPQENMETSVTPRTSLSSSNRQLNLNKQLQQLLEKNSALEKLDAMYCSETKSLKRRLQEGESALREAEKVNEKLNKTIANLNSEVASLKKVREIEHSERLKTESKSLDILEGIKDKWKREGREKDLAFKMEKDRLLMVIKQCNENYKSEINGKCELQKKYDALLKVLDASKPQPNVSSITRRSVSAEVIHVDNLQRQLANLQRNLSEAHEKNDMLTDKVNAAQATTGELEIHISRLEQASKLSEENWLLVQKKLTSDNDDLEEKLNEAQQQLSDLNTELKNKEIDIEVMDKKIKFLCFQNEKLEERAKVLSSDNSPTEEKTSHGMSNEHDQNELKVLKDENLELKELLLQWKQSDLEKSCLVDDLRTHVNVLEEGFKQSSLESFFSASSGSEDGKIDEKDDRISSLSSEVIILKAKISNLEIQLERSKETITREKQDARETRSQLFKAERELKDTKIDLRIAQRDLKAALEQLKKVKTEESQWESEKGKLEKKISEVELSHLRSESELRKLTTKLEYKEKKWEADKCKLESQLETLKVSDLESKAIQAKHDQAEGRIEELVKQLELSEKHNKMMELEAKEWLKAKTQMKENLKQEIEKRQHHEMNANILRGICTDLEDQVQKQELLITVHETEEQRLQECVSRLEIDLKNIKSDLAKAEINIDKEKLKLDEANKKINELERQLEMDGVIQDRELQTVVSQKNEYRANVVKLTQDMATVDEELKMKEYDIASCLKKIDLLGEDNIRLKEEIAALITQIQSLRETNFKLSNGLEEAIVKGEEFKEQIIAHESTIQEIKSAHHAEKLKLNETLSQQMKLIDHLQRKLETPVKKKKTLQEKLFGKTKKHQYKIEVSPSKTNTYSRSFRQTEGSKSSSDDVITALTKSPGSSENQAKLRSQKSAPNCSSERMRHNIPHRFETSVCVHPTKCAVCLETISFGRHVSRCEECNTPAHPKCTNAIPDMCSLPMGLMQHYRYSMKKKKRNIATSVSEVTIDPLVVEQDSSICGWLKIPKSNSHGWDRVFVKLKGTVLLLYSKEDIGERDMPVDTIDLSPSDGIVKIIELVLHNELSWLAKSDLTFIFKLESKPLTTCWPGRTLYMMASSLHEKLNWVSTLEKVARANPNIPKDDGNVGTVIMSLSEVENVDLNCVAFLDEDTVLIGAKEGLYVVDLLNDGHQTLISHFVSVTSIHLVPSLKIVLIVTGNDLRLYWIEISVLRKIINGSVKYMAEALQLLNPVDNIDSCHLIFTSEDQDPVLLGTATANKISVLKWNSQMKSFFLRKVLSTIEPCTCALFTPDSLIIGTDKFYEVELQDFTVEKFLDETDLSLKHILIGAAEMQSFPLAVFQVALSGLPEEYLICYHGIGVFVDSFGHRSRPDDVTWTKVPLGFAFRWPYLYIIHFNSVEVRKISIHRDECFSMETYVEMSNPRYMGFGAETGTIVIANMKEDTIDVLNFDGEIAIKKKMNRLHTTDKIEDQEESISEGNFSYTSSVLEALGESEL